MISLLANLTKAAVATVISPVAIVVDLVTLPASSMDPHRGPFDRASKVFDTIGDCVSEAIKPSKSNT